MSDGSAEGVDQQNRVSGGRDPVELMRDARTRAEQLSQSPRVRGRSGLAKPALMSTRALT